MATILIVSDCATTQEHLATILKDANHRPLHAKDGVEGLTCALVERPDVIITDIDMTTIGGFDFLRRLRADPAIAGTPVVFSTANNHEREAQSRASGCGVARFVAKGCEFEVLLRTVDEALEQGPAEPGISSAERLDRQHLRALMEKLSEKVNALTIANDRLTALLELSACRKEEETLRDSDLTERIRSASLVADIGAALTSQSKPQGMLQLCADALVRHVDAAFARIWTLNEATNDLELRASAGLDTNPDVPLLRMPVGKSNIGLIAQERKPHVTNAVVGDPRLGDPEWAKREGMVAFAGYPLIVDHKLVGVMALFARHTLSDATIQAMPAVADQIAVGIERKRAEEMLQASEQRTRVILDTANDPFIMIDCAGRILVWNRQAEAVFGWSRAEAIGRRLSETIIPCQHRAAHDAGLQAFQTTGKGPILNQLIEVTALRRDGHEFPVELTVWPIRVDGTCTISAFVRDITERKRAEQRALAEHAVTRVLAASPHLADASTLILQVLCEALGWQVGSFWRVDANAQVLRCVQTWQQPSTSVEEFAAICQKTTFTPGIGLPGRVWSNLKPAWIPDIVQDTNLARAPFAAQAGLHGAVAFPVLFKNELVGVVEFFSQEIKQPDEDMLSMMTAIGSQIGQFIERKRANEALGEAQEKYRNIVENAVEGIFQSTPNGRHLSVNRALARIYGYESPEELMSCTTDIQHQLYVDPQRRQELQRLLTEKSEVHGFESMVYRKDRTAIWISENVRAVRDRNQGILYYVGFVEDITERKELEDQLRQAQKMDAIGKLAGGVAHDFNNLLTVIMGYSDVVCEQLRPADPLRDFVEEIRKAGTRATSLTRQLLAFSRKQILVPEIVEVNTLLSDMEKMLTRLIGEDIDLKFLAEPALWKVKVDHGQMEQIILNLIVNARDAMPQGGKLTIETANIELDETYCSAHRSAQPGPYVLVSVSDTGCGMDEATRLRVFEPFFTTKGPEKGTGLGLSTVFGIVKQSNGLIEVYSEPGKGSTFKIYLARAAEEIPKRKSGSMAFTPGSGAETVLLVEDEVGVRTLARLVLERAGYTVIEAQSGPDALRLFQQHPDAIKMTLTDVVMPDMSGPQLAKQLRALRPDLKVLFLSGYTDDAIVRHGIIDVEVPFLQKPFTQSGLLKKVREVLDTRRCP